MTAQRPILIVGGAPRIAVDAVRHLTVAATGTTATQLSATLRGQGCKVHLLLSQDAIPHPGAERYLDRDALELGLSTWIARHPDGCVVMTAAVNDYRVAAVERWEAGDRRLLHPGEKLSSGADEVLIRLLPASKVVDRLRPDFGLRGPIIAFKYEDRATVLASASALCQRIGAACVAANSLCGGIQAIVDAHGHEEYPDRAAMLAELVRRIAAA